jgi:hypothetical protein
MSNDSSLDAIGLEFGTDKASSCHNYLNFYESYFSPLRHTRATILEIGILNGASLETWATYFSAAQIIGVDITPATKCHEGGRVAVEILDQSNIEELTQLAVKHGPFDLIIEDGSHMWEHQITSLRSLFPFLKNDGIYIVEDLQTNYGSMQSAYKGVASSSCVEYLKSWLDLCVGDDQVPLDTIEDPFLRTYGRSIQSMTFHRRACLIKKAFAPIERIANFGKPLVPLAQTASSAAGGVQILGHVSNKGDVFGPRGFINLGPDSFSLQGFSIGGEKAIVEHRVRFSDGDWSPWVESGAFAGTRGQSKILTGFTARLLPHARDRYSLRSFGRFAGDPKVVVAADGQDCVAAVPSALLGIQIELAEKTQAA